jgi:hypothetical protein
MIEVTPQGKLIHPSGDHVEFDASMDYDIQYINNKKKARIIFEEEATILKNIIVPSLIKRGPQIKE